MNPLAQQLLSVIYYWQRKCSLTYLELDAQEDLMTYDYRYGCDCTLISRNGEKINKPYPIPVTDVMVYLVELLDLTNLAYDAIETETDPYLQHYSFVFNFTENLFTVLLDYSYVGIGQELNSIRSSDGDENLIEIFNDLLKDGVIGKWRVDFNGSGDDGYIDDNMGSLQKSDEREISESLNEYLYDFLESRHHGWEEQTGSYGFFIIDIDKKTIELDYTEMEDVNDEITIYQTSIDELIQTISVGEESVD